MKHPDLQPVVDVRARAIVRPDLHSQLARHRLGALLDKHGRGLTGVDVLLTDVNGPRGGIDQRCAIVARGPIGAPILAEATASTMPNAIARASARLGRRLQRSGDRQRQRRRPTASMR